MVVSSVEGSDTFTIFHLFVWGWKSTLWNSFRDPSIHQPELQVLMLVPGTSASATSQGTVAIRLGAGFAPWLLIWQLRPIKLAEARQTRAALAHATGTPRNPQGIGIQPGVFGICTIAGNQLA